MRRLLERLAAWLGLKTLDLSATRSDQTRLAVSWTLALVVVGSSAARFAFELTTDLPLDPFLDRGWVRLYNALTTVENLSPTLVVALLFLSGVGRVSRSEGSWALVTAAVFVLAALGFAAAAAAPVVFVDPNQLNYGGDSWYRYQWFTHSWQFAYLAVPFAFLAYRGLSRPRGRTTRRRRLVPPTPAPEPEV